ncbi:MAG: tRNA threonylcarbamoyladenosine dehydratase [Zoogloeaceae bacterium]|nr:tRNA threonylcarbamoyladenosine dehydratase [Zoogloeaceae bacterium]
MTVPAESLARRFAGTRRLYGEEAAECFAAAHVCVIGLGGVGSWAAEGLARSGIGRLTLIDLDVVAESNTNRQIQALDGAYGEAKVEALARRFRKIHPGCVVTCVDDFITQENVAQFLSAAPRPFSLVIDAIDRTTDKAALLAHCRENALRVVTAGAAGGKKSPLLIRADDLARATQDPLLAKTRAVLRREYGFPKGAADIGKAEKFGIPAVYSVEPVAPFQAACAANTMDAAHVAPQGLSCAGYGSSVCVTASMGFTACAAALECLAAPQEKAIFCA